MRGVALLALGLGACLDADGLPGPCGAPGVICTVAGIGSSGFNGDGLPALETQLYFPTAVVRDPGGALVICDYTNSRIRRMEPDGRLVTIVGNGVHGYAVAGRAVTETTLAHPIDVAFAADGALFIAESHSSRVLRATVDGQIEVVAGQTEAGPLFPDGGGPPGIPGYTGDGGPGGAALLREPTGIAVDDLGRLWISDTGNDVLRLLDVDGTITTVVGDGVPGLEDAEGRPRLSSPQHLHYADGFVYVADTGNRRIRRVDVDTLEVTTVAGSGERGHAGDDGPAIEASLGNPTGVAVDPDGGVWFTDYEENVVRRVDADGVIHREVGDGIGLSQGDRGPAIDASVKRPVDLWIDPDGTVYVLEMVSAVLRRVAP